MELRVIERDVWEGSENREESPLSIDVDTRNRGGGEKKGGNGSLFHANFAERGKAKVDGILAYLGRKKKEKVERGLYGREGDEQCLWI